MQTDDLPDLMCAKCALEDSRPDMRKANEKCPCQANKKDEKTKRLHNWWKVHIRIRRFTKNKSLTFQYLAHALAKYDYFGAPSNWDNYIQPDKTKYKSDLHEYVIMRWTRWAMKKKSKERIWDLIREDVNSNQIPDAFDLMMDYFT